MPARATWWSSIGTSGTVFSVADAPAADPSGIVAGFADVTGRFLPLVCTLNAARVLDAAAAMLRVSLDELADLALSAPPGADGLVMVPYLEGERTPNRPDATGAVHGLTLRTSTPAHLARAAVEGMLCALADGLDALAAHGATVRRVILVRRSSAARWWSHRPASTSPTVPPGRPRGWPWARGSRRPGHRPARRSTPLNRCPASGSATRRPGNAIWTGCPRADHARSRVGWPARDEEPPIRDRARSRPRREVTR